MKTFVISHVCRGRTPSPAALITGLLIMGYAPSASAQKVTYLYPETSRLVALVDEAATFVAQQGEKAFDYFMRDGSGGEAATGTPLPSTSTATYLPMKTLRRSEQMSST